MKDKLNITKDSNLFAINIFIANPKENFEISKQFFKSENPSDLVNQAQKTDCDILNLKFNIKNESNIQEAKDLLKSLLPNITKPLMISGTDDDEIDKVLLPELIKSLDRKNCIISYANEKTYQSIIPEVIKGEHYVVLKTPIDINLAKELNILAADLGLSLNKIIMNPDIGGLGYGYEYGFSILEKIKIEGKKGDKYLDLPILTEASNEALKTKEAKSTEVSNNWGELKTRAQMIELTACSGVLAAGANIIIINAPENITILKGMIKK